MKVTGTVLSVSDGKAKVRVFRESPCAACKGCSGRACHAEIRFDETTVLDTTAEDMLGVHVGDVVELYSDNRFTLGLAFVLFGLPFVFAIVFGIMFQTLLGAQAGVAVGIAAFIVSFIALAFAADRHSAKHAKNVICKIIKESGR